MPRVTLDNPKKSFPLCAALQRVCARSTPAAAIYWYQKSEILRESRYYCRFEPRDFIEALAQEQVDVFVVDFDDLQRELWLNVLL